MANHPYYQDPRWDLADPHDHEIDPYTVDPNYWNQETSDQEDTWRYQKLIKEYEFQERGGFQVYDCVMAKIEPSCWVAAVVIEVEPDSLVVTGATADTTGKDYRVSKNAAFWVS